jgi:hypothetical protein
VPLADSVKGLFLDEWDRFSRGVEGLVSGRAPITPGGKIPPPPDPTKPRTVNLPGWDDVIKLGIDDHSTRDERATFYSEKKRGVESSLSPRTRELIGRENTNSANHRQSAQDESSQAWGSILTAIDNVQDFVSTISSIGRLVIWAALRTPVGRAAIGAGVGAAGTALGLPLLGGMVAIVGGILLVNDLLNMLNLVGMLASPLYGLLCNGIRGFLSAAAPTAIFKRGLKREVWKKATTNPFGRNARADRQLKAMNGRLGVGAIIEAAQTTQQLFGWGLSFGAIMGTVSEAAAAVQDVAQGKPVTITFPSLVTIESRDVAKAIGDTVTGLPPSLPPRARERAAAIAALPAGQRDLVRQAGIVAATMPVTARVQRHFTDDEHLRAMLAYTSAIALLREVWDGVDCDELVASVAAWRVQPPYQLAPWTADFYADQGLDPRAGRRFWFPPYALTATCGEIMDDCIVNVPPAVDAFLIPRMTAVNGVLFGALVCQITEQTWRMWAGDDHILKWELSTDYRLLASLAESGMLWPHNNPPGALWAAWKYARKEIVKRDATSLDAGTWQRIADRYHLDVWHMAPPNAPWPAPPAAWTAAVAPTLPRVL